MSQLTMEVDPPTGGRQRVVVGGRLDTHTFAELDAVLLPLLDADAFTLVLDLEPLEYISSAGLRSIFRARKQLAANGGQLLVVNPQPQIRKVFDMVKAVPLEEIFTSWQEMDAYLDAMQRKVTAGSEPPSVI